jgi:hypothetical protein
MIIFGWRTCESTAGLGTFTCPSCRTVQPYRHVTYRRWFTLYFLPVIPLGRVSEQVECQGCLRSYSMQVLEAAPTDEPFAAVLAQHPATPQAPASWKSAPPDQPFATADSPFGGAGSSWESVRTSSLAIWSLVLGVISPLLLCVCNLSLVTSLAAVITGHLALGQIRRGRGRVEGSGMAVTGLIFGYLLLTLSLALLVFVLPSVRQGWQRASERRLADHSGGENDWLDPDGLPTSDLAVAPNAEVPETLPPIPLPPGPPDMPGPFGPTGLPGPPGLPGEIAHHDNAGPSLPIYPPPVAEPAEANPRPAPPTNPRPAAAPPVNELEIERVHVFSDIGWQIESLVFANDSRWLAAGKLDGMLMMFDLQSLAVIESVSRLNELSQVACLAFSADNGHLFAGGSTGAIQVRTVDPSGRLGPASDLVRHARSVQVLTPSPTSDFLLSGAADGTLTWQTYGRHANHSNSLKAFDRKVLAARLPSDGIEAMATDGRQLRQFDLRNAKETRTVTLANAPAHAADFSTDGTRLAISSLSEIRIWDTASGHEVRTLARDTQEMHWTVRFHPNGRWLVSGGRGRVWIWDIETGRCLATVELDCPFYIQVLAISNDGRLLAITPSAAGQALTIVRLNLDVQVHD